jgi:L-asparaginase
VHATARTFDTEYDELRGTHYYTGTHLPDMLSLARSRLDVEVETLMMVYSLDMGDADRERIAEAVEGCPERHVVVTHGTDTMVDTARVIARACPDKTVVLTGAMIPWAFGSSDGLFNLGSALSFAQVLPPGAWIAMNGRFFPWDRVRKNHDKGVFEEVDPS